MATPGELGYSFPSDSRANRPQRLGALSCGLPALDALGDRAVELEAFRLRRLQGLASSATMNGTLCAIKPLMKWTSRDLTKALMRETLPRSCAASS